jgi:hypothetical protein
VIVAGTAVFVNERLTPMTGYAKILITLAAG